MKKLSSILLSLLLSLFIISCAEGSTTAPKDTPNQNGNNAVVTASFFDDSESSFKDYHEFILVDSEYMTKVVFETDKTVTDFKFFNLDADGLANDGMFSIGEVFYELEEFTPEKPIVIGMGFAGSMPSNAVCFTNADGKAEYYYLTLSGKDESLIFEEFRLGEKAW